MKNRVDQLLEKFYEGATSVEEERELQVLLKDTREEEFESELFHYFENEQNVEAPLDLEQKLEDKLWENDVRENKLVRFWKPMTGVAAAVLLVMLASLWILNQPSNEVWISYETVDTPGEVQLPDGTTIWLNASSEIKYRKEFVGNRELELNGEGYFEVIRDTKSPFIVKSGGTQTQVLGTSFHIRNISEEDQVELNVYTGKVSFKSESYPNEELLVLPGEAAFYKLADKKCRKVEPVSNALAWKTSSLSFEDTSLAHVIRDLERYYNVDIQVSTDKLLSCHFSGTFNSPELTSLLEVLSFSMELKIEQLSQNELLISGKGCK